MKVSLALLALGTGLVGLFVLIAIRISDWRDKKKWHSPKRIRWTLVTGLILGLIMMLGDWRPFT